MYIEYPNLELLVYKSEQYILNSKNEKINRKLKFSVDVFKQIWGSTLLGFDKSENGDSLIGGQAMTEAYTTVVHEETNNIYLVYFASRIAYIVDNPTEKFLNDLKDRNLDSYSEAIKEY